MSRLSSWLITLALLAAIIGLIALSESGYLEMVREEVQLRIGNRPGY